MSKLTFFALLVFCLCKIAHAERNSRELSASLAKAQCEADKDLKSATSTYRAMAANWKPNTLLHPLEDDNKTLIAKTH